MADIEKVIKGLECCTKLGCHHGCEYKSNGYSGMTCRQELEKDALELLKEKEAHWIKKSCDALYCSNCDAPSINKQQYCYRCGSRMT